MVDSKDAVVTVVLSDLHANARALRAALGIAERGRVDRVIVLGDLLTYGADVEETLALVDAIAARWPTQVITGNHDEMYHDLLVGKTEYIDSLPGWLRESIDWTARQIDLAAFRRRYDWKHEIHEGDWLFAHASPFGDHRYINTEDQHAEAAFELERRGYQLGVFGHTHRSGIRLYRDEGAPAARMDPTFLWAPSPGDRVFVNPGSLGQPRSNPPLTSFLRITRSSRHARLEILPVEYDVAGHVATVRALPLSATARDKLASFFGPR